MTRNIDFTGRNLKNKQFLDISNNKIYKQRITKVRLLDFQIFGYTTVRKNQKDLTVYLQLLFIRLEKHAKSFNIQIF